MPSLKPRKVMSPPSLATAGRTRASLSSLMVATVSESFVWMNMACSLVAQDQSAHDRVIVVGGAGRWKFQPVAPTCRGATARRAARPLAFALPRTPRHTRLGCHDMASSSSSLRWPGTIATGMGKSPAVLLTLDTSGPGPSLPVAAASTRMAMSSSSSMRLRTSCAFSPSRITRCGITPVRLDARAAWRSSTAFATSFGGGTRPRAARQFRQRVLSLASAAYESDDVLDRFHGVRRDDLRARGAVGEHGIDVDGIGDEPLHLGIDRAEFDDREIDQRGLEGGELRAAEFVENLHLALARKRGVDAHEVVGLGSPLESLLVVRQGIRIGLRPADLVRNGVGIVGQIDARLVGRIGFRHLLRAVAQRHHARRGTLDQRLGLGKERIAVAVRLDRLSEVVVEFLRDVARELQVLLLVLADGYMRGTINQDVGGHQSRIGVETDRGILAVLARLLLELGHAVEPAEAGDAGEHPGELGMLRGLALVEHDGLFRCHAARHERRGHLARIFRQLLGPAPDRNRLGDGVQVDHAIDAVVLVLQRDELRDGAEIIAEMQVAGRLHAGKHPLLECHARTLAGCAAKWHDPRRGCKPGLGRWMAAMRSRTRPRS